jgi:hypothetical protein
MRTGLGVNSTFLQVNICLMCWREMRHCQSLTFVYVKTQFHCTAELDTLKRLKTLFPFAFPHVFSRDCVQHIIVVSEHQYVE